MDGMKNSRALSDKKVRGNERAATRIDYKLTTLSLSHHSFLQVIEVDRAADARAKILASGAGALGNMVALESLRPYVTRLRNETDISRGVACLALQSMD